jgi:hypothetical protein
MFNLRKNDPAEEFMNAAKANDNKHMADILRKLWNEDPNSKAVHDIAFNISYYGLHFYNFLELYLAQFPGLLHPGYNNLGAFYASEGRHDEATVSARTFLAIFNKSESKKNLEVQTYVPHQLGRAFLITTDAYTQAGARCYSIKLLNEALSMAISAEMRNHIENEITTLNEELKDPVNDALNRKWQEFFSSGKNFEELYNLCVSKNMPVLAKRLVLLETKFRFTIGYSVDTDPKELYEEVIFLTEKDTGQVITMLK